MTLASAAFARRFGSVGALALAATFASSSARALDADVTSDDSSQFYDVRAPAPNAGGGVTVLERRRLTATLGLGLYNLLDSPMGDPKAPDLSLRARVRYDADFGVSPNETDSTNFSQFLPGLHQQLVDLMYAYVEGRRFFGGWMGFKLGRQYQTDVLGWWAFDGAEASVNTPFFVKAEVYGGLEERGGEPLSTPRFEADGVWRGSRSGFDESLFPQFQPARLAPAYGVAIESTGVTWIHGRLSYRRVYDTGVSNTSEFADGASQPMLYDKSRVSSDRLGYAIDASLANIGGAKAGFVYDFYRGDLTSIYGSIDAYLGTKVTVSADYDYYVPSFDGDSIWNFFAGEPTNDLGVRGNVDINSKLSVAGGAHWRIYSVQTTEFDPAPNYSPSPYYSPLTFYPSNGHPFDSGGDLIARYKTGVTQVTLRGSGAWGDEGDRVGADLAGEHIIEGRYIASARVGLWSWDDRLRPDQSATTFSYVLGAGYRFAERSVGRVEWEHDISGLVGNRFRVLLLLSVAVGK
jgi:hypothetical protein